jgi:hypothetical protein
MHRDGQDEDKANSDFYAMLTVKLCGYLCNPMYSINGQKLAKRDSVCKINKTLAPWIQCSQRAIFYRKTSG